MSEISLSHDSLTEDVAPADHDERNVLLTLGLVIALEMCAFVWAFYGTVITSGLT